MIKHIFAAILLLSFSLSAQANKWDLLFDDPQYSSVKISPDGKTLAVRVLSDDKPALAFLERATMKLIGGAKLDGKNEVGGYAWVNNDRVVIQINQSVPWKKKPDNYGELYSVNKDGSRGELIYGYRADSVVTGSRIKKKEAMRGWAGIIDYLPEDDKHILISSTPWNNSATVASILKINVYNGKVKEKVAKGPLPNSSFTTDHNGDLKVATATDKNGFKQAFLFQDNEWQQIPATKYGEAFSAITLSATGKYLYAFDNYQQDLTGLFKLNLEDGSYKEVLTDKKVDLVSASRTVDNRNIYALAVDDEFPAYYMLNKSLPEAKIFKDLIATFPGHAVKITSRTDDGKIYIVKTSSDIEAGKFYLYDAEKQSLAFLFKYYPNVASKQLAYTDPVKIPTSDGLELSGLFTQGQVANKGDIAPLVVYVHGGPHIKDSWGYNADVQYLALNGYSVLQVNFRGSTGYGDKFEMAGYKNWGGLIQQDIYESYQWAIKTGKAEANKACIMGGSFGGYSALQSSINYPDTYKCAISFAGVSDLELMFDEGNIKNISWGKEYLKDTLGTDETVLKAMSPVNGVDKIKIPLFIAHGESDRQVPYEHAERLIDALDDIDKQYEWYSFDGEEHGFYDPKNKKMYMSKVLEFLNEHMM